MTNPSKRFKWMLLAAALVLPVACAETQLISHAGKQMTRSSQQPAIKYKVGTPYRIGDIWYYPHEDFRYTETGVASWYGPNFHGKPTANGETFDQNALTAAHRTLPLPSLVRVTNLDNGRAIVLRINDRGPFAHNRIIDVSRRGSQLLGFEKAGTANVRVEIMAQESRALKDRTMRNGGQSASEVASSMPPQPQAQPHTRVASVPSQPQNLLPPAKANNTVAQRPLPPRVKQPIPTVQPAPRPILPPKPVTQAPVSTPPQQVAVQAPSPTVAAPPPVASASVMSTAAATPGYYIQAAAFSNLSNAERSVSTLNAKWPTAYTPIEIGGRQLFRVRVGPLKDPGVAQIILDKVRASGYPDARVIYNR